MDKFMMPIQPITGFQAPGVSPLKGGPAAGADEDADPKASFQNIFAQALNTVNDSLNTSGEYTKKLAEGSLENLHEMKIASAKAEIMLKLTTQIAAKVSSAATTLFQMQL